MIGIFAQWAKRRLKVTHAPELTISYKVGWHAGESHDDHLNPFKCDTKAHHDWERGYRDGQKWDMAQW